MSKIEKDISIIVTSHDSLDSILSFIRSVVVTEKAKNEEYFSSLRDAAFHSTHLDSLEAMLKRHGRVTLSFEHRQNNFNAVFKDPETDERLGHLIF